MQKIFSGFALIVLSSVCFKIQGQIIPPPSGQTAYTPTYLKDTTAPVILPEVMPSFPGGESALLQFISNNTQYPHAALDSGQMGTSYIQFVVNEKGYVTDIKIKESAGHLLLDKEALRVAHLLPQFTPGMMSGKPVSVYYVLPISFKFTDQ